MGNLNKIQVSVIGAGTCSDDIASLAYEVGRHLALNDCILLCGGLGGVMEHAAKGARENGGQTIGILPGFDISDANPYIDIAVPTGISHARNIVVVRSGMACIAIEGSYGTLSEIAIALKLKKPVIGLNTWDISPDIIKASNPEDAVKKAIEQIKNRS
jgi:uncharacterized protein (TIGR00725 family)